jgi:hypothetical protein
MSSQHIGAAGELLVQYQLLKLGIDSARLTTDSGIDLVAYSPATRAATTIQVKAVERPTPAGGTGRLAIGWSFPDALRAQILALASLSQDAVWLFTADEAREIAQQHSPKNIRRLYWYVNPETPQRNTSPLKQSDMDMYLLDRRAPTLFPN